VGAPDNGAAPDALLQYSAIELKAQLKALGKRISGNKKTLQDRLRQAIADALQDKEDTVPSAITDPLPGEELHCTTHSHTLHLQQVEDMARVFACAKQAAEDYYIFVKDGNDPDAVDRALEMSEGVKECEQTLLEYVGHLVRSKREDALAALRRDKLEIGEAIVTTDWKMKLLSMMFREASKEWYGKKGISCIGVMVLQRVPDNIDRNVLGCSDMPNDARFLVSFYDLITDDPKQDAYSVSCAKMQVYTSLRDHPVEELRVTKIFQEEDGAGCFAGQWGRNSIRHYKEWTKHNDGRCVSVLAVSFGEAQCNKSFLDTHFSYVGSAVTKGVTETKGKAMKASECVSSVKVANLRSSQCWEFTPDRRYQRPCVNGVVDYERMSYTENVSFKDANEKWWIGQRSRNYGMGFWAWHSKEELDGAWTEGCVCPRNKEDNVYDGENGENVGDNEGEESEDGEDGEDGEDNNDNVIASRANPMLKREGGNKRTLQDMQSKVERQGEAIKGKEKKKIKKQKDVGIQVCMKRNGDDTKCSRIFRSKRALRNHKCHFPTLSLRDRVILLASNEARCVELGSHVRAHVNVDVDFDPVTKEDLQNSLTGFDHILANNKVGQYRKVASSGRYNLTPTHYEYLQKHYKRGAEKKEERIPPHAVHENMRRIRIAATGRLLFNRREDNIHGRVLSAAKIKSWFSQTKGKQGTQPIEPRLAFWLATKVDELRLRVDGNQTTLPRKKKPVLAKMLADKEKTENTIYGFVNGAYIVTPPVQ
jgi:hypothetical protein